MEDWKKFHVDEVAKMFPLMKDRAVAFLRGVNAENGN